MESLPDELIEEIVSYCNDLDIFILINTNRKSYNLLKSKITNFHMFYELASENGHLSLLKWLYGNNHPYSPFIYSAAAEGGHLEIIQWLHEKGCITNPYICNYAARRGNLEILK